MYMRIFNLALMIIAIAGLVIYFNHLPEAMALKREEKRLLDLVGNMQVTKEKKFHLVAVDTGHKTAFAWRLDCREDTEYSLYSEGVHRQFKGWNNLANPYLHRGWPDEEKWIYASFRFGKEIFEVSELGSTALSSSPELCSFFNQHWGELEIKTTVGKETVATDLKEAITLVSINVPSHLFDELDELNIKGTDRYKEDFVYKLIIGPPELAEDVNAGSSK